MEKDTDLKLIHQILLKDGCDRLGRLEITVKGGAEEGHTQNVQLRGVTRDETDRCVC